MTIENKDIVNHFYLKIKDKILINNMRVEKRFCNIFFKHFKKLFINYLILNKVIQIRGLGTFKKIKNKERVVTNFKNNNRLKVEGKEKIKWTPALSLKKRIKKLK